jgi:hypothetical protein
LIALRARHYDSRLGRFLQPDPILEFSIEQPYIYVGNDPVNYIDPLGTYRYSPNANPQEGESSRERRRREVEQEIADTHRALEKADNSIWGPKYDSLRNQLLKRLRGLLIEKWILDNLDANGYNAWMWANSRDWELEREKKKREEEIKKLKEAIKRAMYARMFRGFRPPGPPPPLPPGPFFPGDDSDAPDRWRHWNVHPQYSDIGLMSSISPPMIKFDMTCLSFGVLGVGSQW